MCLLFFFLMCCIYFDNINSAHTWPLNAFVLATAISGPQHIGNVASQIFVILLVGTFVMHNVFALCFLQSSTQADNFVLTGACLKALIATLNFVAFLSTISIKSSTERVLGFFPGAYSAQEPQRQPDYVGGFQSAVRAVPAGHADRTASLPEGRTSFHDRRGGRTV